MEDGTYIVKDGVVYKITPKIKIPFTKSVNVITGEVYYPTKADRIRSMSDEELARFLDNHGSLWGADIVSTADDWLDWLREEATDGKQNQPAP